MAFENRRPGNIEVDGASIDLYFKYNAEQLIYKREIIDAITKYDTNLAMLEVMGELGQVSFDILSKNENKKVILQEENELYFKHIKKEIEKKTRYTL